MKYRLTRSRENSQTNKRQTNIQKERQKLRTAKWNINFCCTFQEDENTPKKTKCLKIQKKNCLNLFEIK